MKTKLILITIVILFGLGMHGIAQEHESNKASLLDVKVESINATSETYELDHSEICKLFEAELTDAEKIECEEL